MAERDLKLGIELDKSGATAGADAMRQELMAMNAQLIADAIKAAKVEAAERNRAAKESADERRKIEREAAEEKRRLERQAAEEAKRLAREEAAAKRDAAREAERVAREAAEREAQIAAEKAAREKKIAADRAEYERQTRLSLASAVERAERQAYYGGAEAVRALKRTAATEAEDISKAFEASGKKTEESFKLGAAGLATLAAGLAGVKLALSAIGNEAGRLGEWSRSMSAAFAQQTDQLRELAAIRGAQAGTDFTLQVAREAASAGMTADEGKQFQTSFYNKAAQYQDRVGAGQFEQYRDLAASYLTAKGIDPASSGDLAGGFLGFRDFSKIPEKKRAETALSDMNAAFTILGRGAGDNSMLTRSLASLGSSLVSEEPGAMFRNAADLATVISTAAEYPSSTPTEQINAAVKALTDFQSKKTGPLLAEAGIKPGMGFMESMSRLTPAVEARAAREGKPVDQILRETVEDQQGARALSVQIQRGQRGGIYADRFQAGRGAGGVAGAMDFIARFQNSTPGQLRAANADASLSEAEYAAQNADIGVIRKQAQARLLREGRTGTLYHAAQDALLGKMTFGFLGDLEQKRIDDEAQRMLETRAPGSGDVSSTFGMTPLERERDLRNMSRFARKQGINPILPAVGEENAIDRREGLFFKDGPGGIWDNFNWMMGGDAPYNPQAIDQNGKIVSLLEQQNRLLEQNLGNRQPPRPIVEPKQAQRR